MIILEDGVVAFVSDDSVIADVLLSRVVVVVLVVVLPLLIMDKFDVDLAKIDVVSESKPEVVAEEHATESLRTD